MDGRSPSREDFGWLVDDFAAGTPGVEQAVPVSADGLLLHAGEGLDRDVADPLAALTTGLLALGDNAGRLLGAGGCEQAMVRIAGCTCLITAVTPLAAIAVVVTAGARLPPVAEQMAHLVRGAGRVLSPQARDDLAARLPAPKQPSI